jgi:hypothetical protein
MTREGIMEAYEKPPRGNSISKYVGLIVAIGLFVALFAVWTVIRPDSGIAPPAPMIAGTAEDR